MRGKIKWFNDQKGYGFLTGEDGKDTFVHATAIDDASAIVEGAAVEYEIEQGPKGPRAKAVKLLAGWVAAVAAIAASWLATGCMILLLLTIVAYSATGQTTTAPAIEPPAAPFDAAQDKPTEMIDFTAWLGSPLMIVLVTGVLVQVVKKKTAELPVLAKLPIWLYAVLIAGGLTCLATYGLGTLQGDPLSLLVNILGNVLWTLGGYGLLFGLTKTPATAAAGEVQRSGNTTVGPGGAGWSGMIVLAAALAATAGGCSGMSNGQKFIIAGQTYSVTANTLAVLVREGEFGTVDKTRIRLLNDTCKDILLKMSEDLAGGQTSFTFQYALSQFQTILDEMLRMQLVAEAAKKRKGTNVSNTNGSDHPGDRVGDGQADDGVPGDGTDTAGSRGEGNGQASLGCPRQPGRRAEWRSPCPAPDPGLTITVGDEVTWEVSQETEWD